MQRLAESGIGRYERLGRVHFWRRLVKRLYAVRHGNHLDDVFVDPDHPFILPFLVQNKIAIHFLPFHTILIILASFLSWFETKSHTFSSFPLDPDYPCILPFLV